ncbi:hypothetical protein BGI23_17415 [Bacillus sp. ABP14]|nr:hypothetical protein BGI23_17415 [Bacillus sp. ABP14]
MIYPAICRAVRPPPQNLAEAKESGRDQLPVKARLVRANNQWGMNKTPTDFIVFYLFDIRIFRV